MTDTPTTPDTPVQDTPDAVSSPPAQQPPTPPQPDQPDAAQPTTTASPSATPATDPTVTRTPATDPPTATDETTAANSDFTTTITPRTATSSPDLPDAGLATPEVHPPSLPPHRAIIAALRRERDAYIARAADDDAALVEEQLKARGVSDFDDEDDWGDEDWEAGAPTETTAVSPPETT